MPERKNAVKPRFLPPSEARIIRQHGCQTAKLTALIAGVMAALTVSMVLQSCTPAAATHAPAVSDGYPIPADWIENPTAGIVLDPVSEEAQS